MSYVDEPVAIEAANGSGKLIRDVKSACFTPKELANIIWAVTHIGLPHRRLYKLVARHMIWYIDHFDSVNLSLALWGFAKMDVCSPELFHAAAPVIIKMIETFEPHRLCNTAWAFSKTLNAQDNEKLFSAIASVGRVVIDKFNLSNESMLVYSFALAQYKEPVELIGMILKQQIRAIKRGEVNDPRSFANMAWGAAELGVGAKYQDLYTAIADYLARRPRILNDFGINQLATLCLALMMVESKAPQIRVLFDHVRDICATKQMDSTMRTDLMNLQAAFNYYRIDSGCVREALQELLKMEIQQKQERERLIAEQQQQAALMARQKLILGRFTSLSQAIREILVPLVGALLVLFITRRLKLWLLSQ
ncbi:hypothetical protein FOZ62_002908 [Perkinsus olseni]|uniref:RNA-editing substrate-binding complex 6 protein domain-containing protein n=1 Tax=Perkinsus olseni TaxID=32597 RepID=A0A7J6QGA5_PEROL|nr:hypothetical protein FOZ62_002908 [Perkinsus olseni]